MTDTIGLIGKAYAAQKEVDTWLPRLVRTGELDNESFARMAQLRVSIISSDPVSDMDRLMQFGAIRSVASFLYSLTDCEPDEAVEALSLAQSGLAEILVGLNNLRPKIETDANATLDDLGLFIDRNALQ